MRSTGLQELDLRSMLEAEEKPDSRYWLDYDYFMIEHEARAVRREYAYALLVRLAKLPARIFARMPRQKRLSF